MKHVWLCGASEKVSFEDGNTWRKKCVKWFEDNSKYFRAWNPNDFYNYNEQLHKSDFEIMRFCYNKVKESDVIMVNLNRIRQSVGSHMELAWAFEIRKPIIGFSEEGIFYANPNDGFVYPEDVRMKYFKNEVHPWIYECCGRIEFGDGAMEDALLYIEKYYGE